MRAAATANRPLSPRPRPRTRRAPPGGIARGTCTNRRPSARPTRASKSTASSAPATAEREAELGSARGSAQPPHVEASGLGGLLGLSLRPSERWVSWIRAARARSEGVTGLSQARPQTASRVSARPRSTRPRRSGARGAKRGLRVSERREPQLPRERPRD